VRESRQARAAETPLLVNASKDQLIAIGKICGGHCEYYDELAKTLADAHAL
jgi:hypothetical protein